MSAPPINVSVDLAALNRICGAGAVSRGRVYYEAARVLDFQAELGGDTIWGSVRGSTYKGRTAHYQSWVHVGPDRGVIGGECTCPVGRNCKHVVATAFAAAGVSRQFALTQQPTFPEPRPKEKVPPVLVYTAHFTGPTKVQLTPLWEYREPDGEVRQRALHQGGPYGFSMSADEVGVWYGLARVMEEAGLDNLPINRELAFAGFEAMWLVDTVLPLLASAPSVEVVVVGEPGFTELTEQPVIELAATDSTDADWFDLAVTIRVGSREVPLPDVLTALSKGHKRLMLTDGTWLRLTHEALEPLRDLLAEADRVTDRKGALRISRHQAALWDELAELADVVEQSENWRQSVGGLLKLLKLIECDPDAVVHDATPVPAGISATMRPYQLSGFQWLTFCWRHGLGGILADDMGLGKTLQTLALVQHARDLQPTEPPFLVVAPASVTGNWLSEVAKFAPGLRAVVVGRKPGDPQELSELTAGVDIVITSYAIFRLGEASFRAQQWSGLILDEAQFIKNKSTKANQAARRLKAPFKLAITGTPMENNVTELWALMAVVAPGLFPTYEGFREDYARPVAAMHKPAQTEAMIQHGRDRLETLRRRVRPLLLRRTKAQVAPELPARTEQTVTVELDPKHRRVYDIHLQRERKRVLMLLDDFEANRVAVFRALTTLRRLALDASLIDAEAYADVPSSKLDVLVDQIESIIAEGHRALVFSQFTGYLAIVRDRLAARGIEYAYLDGSTRGRAAVVDQFRNGSAPLFLISLKAGGFGLNLTEADYVFLLDPWWNPAVEAQAIDRTHRIGQTKPVMVHRLVAANTIEEKVMALKARKAALVGAVLRDDLRDDDAATSTALTAADIKSLLA